MARRAFQPSCRRGPSGKRIDRHVERGELEEAGKVAGASSARVLGRIVLPLVAAGVFNSWIWISMLSYREVTMALALGTRKNLVISTIVWQFWGNGWVPQVAALGVVLVFFAVLVVGGLKIGFGRLGEWYN